VAHVQRKCAKCRRSVPEGKRACPACGSRDAAYIARWLDPERVEKSRAFARKVDAEQWIVNMEAAKNDGSYVDPAKGRCPVAEVVESWYAAAVPSLKPKTRASYRGLIDVRIVPYIGSRQVASLRPSDVQHWVNDLTAAGLSASRVRQAHILLGQALDAAVGDGVIARNPARRAGVKLPKLQRREAAWFTPGQVASIAEAAPRPYDLLVRLLGQTGLRWGEAVALRRRSVDLLGRSLLVRESLAEVGGELTFGPTKSHAERRVPLTASLVAGLEEHLDEHVAADPDSLLFTSAKGHPVRYANFRREVWVPALRAAKLPKVGLHVLRHSAAAAWIRAGASPKALQSVLGHGSAAFTLTVYGPSMPTWTRWPKASKRSSQ
jgi:integrase